MNICLSEIIVANCIGALLVAFLVITRREIKENRWIGEHFFNVMLWITFASCLIEILTFLHDGKNFPGVRFISYLDNSFLFIATGIVGFLWVLYVDFRILKNIHTLRLRARFLILPLIAEIILLIVNACGVNVVFTITEQNVYERGPLVILSYIILLFYFIYSISIVIYARVQKIERQFFPVTTFVVPCMVGTILQGLFYGMVFGWLAVAVSLCFVYIQLQNRRTFTDPLTGLHNRAHLDFILRRIAKRQNLDYYGIMIDMDDFKSINDNFGHEIGDDALRTMGLIISDSLPPKATAIRFAGDEFIILIPTTRREDILAYECALDLHLTHFNEQTDKPYRLSCSHGHSFYDARNGSMDAFLREMDLNMYEQKRLHKRVTK